MARSVAESLAASPVEPLISATSSQQSAFLMLMMVCAEARVMASGVWRTEIWRKVTA
ncbi:MAG: hypothetical protein R3D67_12215 [Hyphomicrobiaceae bacterium]